MLLHRMSNISLLEHGEISDRDRLELEVNHINLSSCLTYLLVTRILKLILLSILLSSYLLVNPLRNLNFRLLMSKAPHTRCPCSTIEAERRMEQQFQVGLFVRKSLMIGYMVLSLPIMLNFFNSGLLPKIWSMCAPKGRRHENRIP